MKLKEARFKRGLTQFQLRLLTGIHQSKISFIEHDYVVPNEAEKLELAKALNVKPGELEYND